MRINPAVCNRSSPLEAISSLRTGAPWIHRLRLAHAATSSARTDPILHRRLRGDQAAEADLVLAAVAAADPVLAEAAVGVEAEGDRTRRKIGRGRNAAYAAPLPRPIYLEPVADRLVQPEEYNDDLAGNNAIQSLLKVG